MPSKPAKPPFDRIVISSDTNPKFLSLWPYVARGWHRLYGIYPTLAVVGDLTTTLDPAHTVIRIPEVPGIPIANQAKMARYFVAAFYDEPTVVIINDVDLLPVSRSYIDGLVAQRKPNTLMAVGAELYTGPEAGKFPVGWVTAEAGVFRRLINPDGLRWAELLNSWKGLRVFDHKEDITRDVYHEHPDTFSDESLLRALIHRNNIPVTHVARGFQPYTERALCRSRWHYQPARIDDGTIVEAHLLRPYSDHRQQLEQLFHHLGIACAG